MRFIIIDQLMMLFRTTNRIAKKLMTFFFDFATSMNKGTIIVEMKLQISKSSSNHHQISLGCLPLTTICMPKSISSSIRVNSQCQSA